MKWKYVQAIAVGCLLLACGCTAVKEDIPNDSEIRQTETANEESKTSAEKVTLSIWSDADQENKTYMDTTAESIQIFTELYSVFSSQKENTEDIAIMGDEGFDSIPDGVIECDDKSISFLNDRFTWNDTTYDNAWYLQIITQNPYQTISVILPEESEYIPTLKQLLEIMHYQDLKNEIEASNS